MTPDHPKHGTRTGYRMGCRDTCCRTAQMRYMKLYRLGRARTYIPSIGTRRRIQALLALGWTHRDIGERLGRSRNFTHELLGRLSIRTDVALRIAEVYEAMCMTLPQGELANRARILARRKGYLPPLAWDDIDDPDERPQVGTDPRWRAKDDVDHAVVARVVNGERLPMTRAERVEVVRRLRDDWGWSEERIEHHTGIAKATNRNRYPTRPQEDAA